MQAAADSVETEVEIPRKVWTREEAHALVDAGIPNAEKLELVNGELINRMGKKRPHVVWQNQVHQWLSNAFGAARVESESPTDVAKEDNTLSEPEPDLKVLRKASKAYSSNPQPEDILLVAEISDSNVRFDLKIKAKLYARAGILEYWVINVHREPKAGMYASVITYRSNEEVTPLSAPDAIFCMERL